MIICLLPNVAIFSKLSLSEKLKKKVIFVSFSSDVGKDEVTFLLSYNKPFSTITCKIVIFFS